MKAVKFAFANAVFASLLGIGTQAVAAEPVPPELQALYTQKCTEWSKQSWIADDKRQAFYSQCLKDVPQAYPTGRDSGGGGE